VSAAYEPQNGDFQMTHTTAMTAFAALTSLSLLAQPLSAGNAGASPAACANHVVQACNTAAHPEACTEAGLNACDEHFKTKGASADLVIKIKGLSGGRYKAIIVEPVSEEDDKPRRLGGSDTSSESDRDTSGSSDRDTSGSSDRDPTGGADRDAGRDVTGARG
jgi:hypothetical protein